MTFAHLPDRPLPYVTSNALAFLLEFKSQSAVRRWAKREGVIGVRRGKRLFYDLRDVERVLSGHAPSLRRAS